MRKGTGRREVLQMLSFGSSSIMVRIGEPAWTLAALHLACAVARTHRCELLLVKMVPVSHASWLGTEFGNQNFTERDRRFLQECSATAEDYGITFSTGVYQYFTLSEAIVDAAEHFNTRIVFASLPQYKLPFWRRFLMWQMRRQFAKQGRLLYALDETFPDEAQVPHILVPAETPEPTLTTKS
jgi:hypothetical protein